MKRSAGAPSVLNHAESGAAVDRRTVTTALCLSAVAILALSGCASTGKVEKVPYTANYYFYRAGP